MLLVCTLGCSDAPRPTFDGEVVANEKYRVTLGFDLRDDNAPKAGVLIRPGVPVNAVVESSIVVLPFESGPSYRQSGMLSTWGTIPRCCTLLTYVASRNTTGAYLIPIAPVFDAQPEDTMDLPGQLYFLKHGLERRFVYKYNPGTANSDSDMRSMAASALAPEAIAIAAPANAEWKEVAPGSTESPAHLATNAVARFYPGNGPLAGTEVLQLHYALPLSANGQLAINTTLHLAEAVSPALVVLGFLRLGDPSRRRRRRIVLWSGILVEGGVLAYIGWMAYSARTVDAVEAGLGALVLLIATMLSVYVGYISNGPTIANLVPLMGPVGAAVIIGGSNFGTSRAASDVLFNGTSATITNWGDDRIAATVPGGATTGSVVVRVGKVRSNRVPFTVT